MGAHRNPTGSPAASKPTRKCNTLSYSFLTAHPANPFQVNWSWHSQELFSVPYEMPLMSHGPRKHVNAPSLRQHFVRILLWEWIFDAEFFGLIWKNIGKQRCCESITVVQENWSTPGFAWKRSHSPHHPPRSAIRTRIENSRVNSQLPWTVGDGDTEAWGRTPECPERCDRRTHLPS